MTRRIPAGGCRLQLAFLLHAVVLTVAALWTMALPASAQVQHRFGVRIPMRDGVELAADMWVPTAEGRYPTVLVRTPYLKTGERWPKMGYEYASRGYVFVIQDVRGRGDSEGQFGYHFQEGQDGYDTVEWLARQPWSDGKVGMVGGSYLGLVQWMAAREDPPHLACIFPQAAPGRHLEENPALGGAWLMQWSLNWLNGVQGRIAQNANAALIDWDNVFQHRPLLTMDSVMGRVMPMYREWLRHPTMDDYWRRDQFREEHFRELDIPAVTVTGWFDADQAGALHYWRGMRKHSPARDRQHLLSGAWDHGETRTGGTDRIGHLQRSARSIMDIDSLALAWFDHCLKGTSPSFDFPRARVFITGLNIWKDLSDYPPPEAEYRRLYLHSGGRANTMYGDGRLGWDEPGDEPPDRYVYDPKNPVPSAPSQPGEDQQVVERRDDVLVYTSELLAEPVEILGTVWVVLHAATDARDTDFTAKIMDVYPDDRALRLGSQPVAVIRARHRKGVDRQELLTPDRPEEYRMELYDIGHAFLSGHRIRIEISSSAYPYIAPNQSTGNPVATDTQWRIARQTVFHDRSRSSHVLLPVMPGR